MNPLGLLVILVGIAMMIIGFKGSQHETLAAIKGQSVSSSSNTPKPLPKLPPLPNPKP